MFTIKVVESSTGKPANYKKVAVGFKGLLGGFTKDQYTNPSGEAHFDYDNGEAKVYVGGKVVYEGYVSGRIVVYI